MPFDSSRPRPLPVDRTFPGLPTQIREVRRFLRDRLGDHSRVDDALLVVSELATNAVEHTRSARPGGRFTVRIITRDDDTVRIEVTDQGGPERFGIPSEIGPREGGRGLTIITALAKEWGVTGTATGRTVWAELTPDR